MKTHFAVSSATGKQQYYKSLGNPNDDGSYRIGGPACWIFELELIRSEMDVAYAADFNYSKERVLMPCVAVDQYAQEDYYGVNGTWNAAGNCPDCVFTAARCYSLTLWEQLIAFMRGMTGLQYYSFQSWSMDTTRALFMEATIQVMEAVTPLKLTDYFLWGSKKSDITVNSPHNGGDEYSSEQSFYENVGSHQVSSRIPWGGSTPADKEYFKTTAVQFASYQLDGLRMTIAVNSHHRNAQTFTLSGFPSSGGAETRVALADQSNKSAGQVVAASGSESFTLQPFGSVILITGPADGYCEAEPPGPCIETTASGIQQSHCFPRSWVIN